MHHVSIITHRPLITVLLQEIQLTTLRARIHRMLHHPLLQSHITRPVEVCLTLTNDYEIRVLNAQYRQQDKATDVLSFALNEGEVFFTPPDEPLALGDLIISMEKAVFQTKRGALPRLLPYLQRTWTLQDEVSFLMLHGLLHLLGYDHIDEDEAIIMENLEHQLLPYLLGHKRTQST
jgi:probable rRNA maturation factor